MRLLKRLALAFAGFVVVVLGVGLLLPSAWQTQRSTEIKAGSEHILPFIETPKLWLDWAPWTPTRYPGMTVNYEGPERGAGARWSWTGEKSGSGSLTITRSDPTYGIDFDLEFDGHEPSKGSIRFEPIGDGTKVTWSMWGDMGMSPVGRYFGLLMDSMMQADFETGLTNLETQAEAAQARARSEADARAAAEAAARADSEGGDEEGTAADGAVAIE